MTVTPRPISRRPPEASVPEPGFAEDPALHHVVGVPAGILKAVLDKGDPADRVRELVRARGRASSLSVSSQSISMMMARPQAGAENSCRHHAVNTHPIPSARRTQKESSDGRF
jgi:hypothetical protein